jgi:hypothetical protein
VAAATEWFQGNPGFEDEMDRTMCGFHARHGRDGGRACKVFENNASASAATFTAFVICAGT